jgi:hypothetical protein
MLLLTWIVRIAVVIVLVGIAPVARIRQSGLELFG